MNPAGTDNDRIFLPGDELRQLVSDIVRDVLSDSMSPKELAGTGGTTVHRRIEAGGPNELDHFAPQGYLQAAKTVFEVIWSEVKCRSRGEYPTDDFGHDPHFSRYARPILDIFYQYYFSCQVDGGEHIPPSGKAIIVSNQGGIAVWDVIMLKLAVLHENSYQRQVRALYPPWLNTLPLVGDLFQKLGDLPYCRENCEHLLKEEHVVAVFPEDTAGAAKLFAKRDRLGPFRRTDFISLALRDRIPIIPCAILGLEGAHPGLTGLDRLSKVVGLPFLPTSLLPLPGQWKISFMPVLAIDYPREEFLTERGVVNEISQNLRQLIQQRLTVLRQRPSRKG